MRIVRRAFHALAGAGLAVGCGTPPEAPTDASLDAFEATTTDATADVDACPSICGSPCPAPFVPGTPPGIPEGGVCSTGQIDGFWTSCLAPLSADGGDAGGCTSFQTANAGCVACLVTDDTSSTWGALVKPKDITFYRANVAGCLSKTSADPTCGARAANALACAEYFCTSICPWPFVEGDAPSFAARLKCLEDARHGYCNSWNKSDCAPADAGPTAACGGDTFEATYRNVAQTLCGTKDAGGN